MFGIILRKFFQNIALVTEKTKDLKIDSVEENKDTGLLYLVVKINGKCTAPIHVDPLKLFHDTSNKKSNLFSDEDFNLILDSTLENQTRITHRKYIKKFIFIKCQYAEQTGEPLLVYQDILTNQYHIKTVREIFSDVNLINNFDSKDSACIGSIYGAFEAEKQIIQKNAESNPIAMKANEKIIQFRTRKT